MNMLKIGDKIFIPVYGAGIVLSVEDRKVCDKVQKYIGISLLLDNMNMLIPEFKIDSYIILPFETQHDCEGSMGFLIQHEEMGKMLFITDSYYCKYKFKGLEHIFIECNYSNSILDNNFEQGYLPIGLRNRLIKSHFSLENVKEFLKSNDLRLRSSP
jgi:hypothetical protein